MNEKVHGGGSWVSGRFVWGVGGWFGFLNESVGAVLEGGGKEMFVVSCN